MYSYQNVTEESPEPPQKLHDWNIRPKTKKFICEKPLKIIEKNRNRKTGPGPITWTVSDIAKAGGLLSSPPTATDFEDEQEMRRVYTLIYDVFRYKTVLTKALNDISFFQIYSELGERIPHVWLLFYDLYYRSFKKRETAVVSIASKLFKETGLSHTENCLWEQRVKLAASVARLRIQNNALSLSDLLPNHLRDERVTGQAANNPVTCWVNTKKIKSEEELRKQIGSAFNLNFVESLESFGPMNFKWDQHCPQIIAFHASMRPQLARSDLVRNFKLVVQDKSFCLGPATFEKLVSDLDLTGSVIQTHVNSPRTTAYLANLLSQNEKIHKLMAFSAGKRKPEYEDYFSRLGMTNIRIFSDRLIDVSPDSNYMEEVVAVFATPPNSYSAVNDPIDLVCSRGGDLSMLEVLTESDETKEGKERVCGILEEQKRTLRFAMSRPQIQFVLYETHSELDIENNEMVQKIVKEVNRVAKLHHAVLQGKIVMPTPQGEPAPSIDSKEINNNDFQSKVGVKESKGNSSLGKTLSMDSYNEEKILDKIKVPNTDIFDLPSLPSLCASLDGSCMNLSKEGCFLALLQRKQVIRLDNKYMILMAETRGLFDKTSSTSRGKGSKGSRKKQEKPPTPPQRTKRRIKDSEVARIAAPTHTFLRHTMEKNEITKCPKCQQLEDELEQNTNSIYRQWWTDTTRHLTTLRSTLARNKVITNKSRGISAKAIVNTLGFKTNKIDEIAAHSRQANGTPLFPKLRLPREHKIEKIQMQIPVTLVEFPLFTR